MLLVRGASSPGVATFLMIRGCGAVSTIAEGSESDDLLLILYQVFFCCLFSFFSRVCIMLCSGFGVERLERKNLN